MHSWLSHGKSAYRSAELKSIARRLEGLLREAWGRLLDGRSNQGLSPRPRGVLVGRSLSPHGRHEQEHGCPMERLM